MPWVALARSSRSPQGGALTAALARASGTMVA
ncbi:hypothetical protein L332_05985 [Agrococcus pavilionensis RW1]|uniref:Uncharacterized protein n=1 Tax=Agrococcus pavilionensis RW1 TaxID=1330458 RepID=U1MTK2_9MICO|nr:hypothetical protein L332_05985 [Agrococcus pavilionensis RW1]